MQAHHQQAQRDYVGMIMEQMNSETEMHGAKEVMVREVSPPMTVGTAKPQNFTAANSTNNSSEMFDRPTNLTSSPSGY